MKYKHCGIKYYAGIGSRETPRHIRVIMYRIAQQLEKQGYILRSGGAVGADKAFERGVSDCNNKEIFLGEDCQNWCYNEAVKHFPKDRNKNKFFKWKPEIRNLIGRNMMQILGYDGDTPVDFVICYCQPKYDSASIAGGTVYAVRCANHYGIKVYNLYIPSRLKELVEDLRIEL